MRLVFLNFWQVLQLHNSAEKFVEVTELFLNKKSEQTEEVYSENRVQAGFFLSLNTIFEGDVMRVAHRK
jgi:hypothetical protein